MALSAMPAYLCIMEGYYLQRAGTWRLIMPKVRNVRVRVSVPDNENPYKKGTHKWRLFQWALAQEETFTKVEFLAAEKQLFEEHDQTSCMTEDIRSKAWWNEFYNKHKTFVYDERPSASTE